MGRIERYFRGKVCVVTGGAAGMGRELVVQLAAAGASVAVCDINAKLLDTTLELAMKASGSSSSPQTVSAHAVDVSDRARLLAFVDEVLAQHGGRVDAVFNNAGVVCVQSTFATTFEEWDRVFNIDLYGVVNCTLGFLPHLVKAPVANVVNTSSIAGIAGMPGNSAYGTAKFAVRGFSEILLADARFLHPNLNVTVVHPGGVTSNIFENCTPYIHDTKLELPGGAPGLSDAPALQGMLNTMGGTTPEAAATQILSGVAAGRTRIMVGTDCWLLDIVCRISPHFMLGGRIVNLAIPGLAVVVARFIGRKVMLCAGLIAAAGIARRLRLA